MNDKRFKVSIDSNNGVGLFDNSATLLFIKFTNKEDAVSCRNALMCHCNLLNELYEEKEQMKKRLESSETTSNATSHYNAFLESKITTLEKENEQLKRERDDWKSSTCSYMNKDFVLSMDCQIVQEALWELEKEIEFGSKREDLFFDLKEKFEKLNNHRIRVFE